MVFKFSATKSLKFVKIKMEVELEALAKDINDVTDPSSYDKVLIYFEELQKEGEEFIEVCNNIVHITILSPNFMAIF